MTWSPGASKNAPRHRSARRRDRRGGFTLLELLTVLGILVLLGGISAGVFQVARRNLDLSASATRVATLIQSARNTAVSSGAPVKVVVTSRGPLEPFVVEAKAYEVLGEWSFEEVDRDSGQVYAAPGEYARLQGAEIVEGHIGRGARLGGGFIDCGNSPRYDARFGLSFDAWIHLDQPLSDVQHERGASLGSRGRSAGSRSSRSSPAARGSSESGPSLPPGGSRRSARASGGSTRASAPGGSARTIVAKGEAFHFGLTSDGRLDFWIGGPYEAGGYHVRTTPEAVLPGRWTRVDVDYDGDSLRLAADGVERPWRLLGYEDMPADKQPPLPAEIPVDDASLTLGSARGSFPGKIDEVRLRGLVEPERFEAPPDQFVLGWRKEIYFDRRGHLDPRFHENPVRIVILEVLPEDQDVRPGKTEVARDYSLTYREWAALRRAQGVIELPQDEIERRLEAKYAGRRKVEIVVNRLGTVR